MFPLRLMMIMLFFLFFSRNKLRMHLGRVQLVRTLGRVRTALQTTDMHQDVLFAVAINSQLTSPRNADSITRAHSSSLVLSMHPVTS